jgi:hypothetical protein
MYDDCRLTPCRLAAPPNIDRESRQAEPSFQNSNDLDRRVAASATAACWAAGLIIRER